MASKVRKEQAASRTRERFIDSALAVFLESGYGGTTIDAIVDRAGGSKATIYKHFKNKEELFAVVIDKLVQHHPVEDLNPDEPPEDALLSYAEDRLKVVFAPEHNALRRLVIGEGGRFANIAQVYYTHGPGRSRKQLEEYFQEQQKRGTLSIDNPLTAADIFQALLMHRFYQVTLYSVAPRIATKELKQHAQMAVDKFLQLYRA